MRKGRRPYISNFVKGVRLKDSKNWPCVVKDLNWPCVVKDLNWPCVVINLSACCCRTRSGRLMRRLRFLQVQLLLLDMDGALLAGCI